MLGGMFWKMFGLFISSTFDRLYANQFSTGKHFELTVLW